MEKDKIDEVLDYRGYHVDFYFDDPGQQIYTVFDGEEIGFGAYNSNYIDDMKYIIDNKLDTITNFPELQKEGIYGAELRWFDNAGWDDIKLTYKGRIIHIYTVGNRNATYIAEFISDARSELHKWKDFWKKETK